MYRPGIKTDLIKTLRLTRLLVPVVLAFIGSGYTFYEHFGHAGDQGWPLPTFLSFFVLVLVGPSLTWLALHWALSTANVYLQTQEKLTQRASELNVLNQLITASQSLDLRTTLNSILERSMEALDACAGMLFLRNGDSPDLTLAAHRGISNELVAAESTIAPGHCLCGQAIERRQVVFSPVLETDERCSSALCICEGFKSVACAPLDVKGQLVGLMQLASRRPRHFSPPQLEFLHAAAAHISVSIENARLYDQVRSFNTQLERQVGLRTRELIQAQKQLEEKNAQLKRLLRESYRVQQETEERIAHDMHDGVTQTIIGALYETQAAQEALIKNPGVAAVNLARAQELLTEVDQEIRRVIYNLHPPLLDMKGLVVATRRYAATCGPVFEIQCNVVVNGMPRRLEKFCEVTVFRIIQSAMQNIATHAQARWASVVFDFEAERFRVVLEDDGRGFDPQSFFENPGEHLGIMGMIERAESLGGMLTITSQPGRGTRVVLELPHPPYIDTSLES